MKESNAMTVTGHLGELRKRLLLILSVVVVTLIAGLVAAPHIIAYLKSVPPAADMSWNVFSPWDSAKIYMSVAFIVSIAISLPFILYQVWEFVKKGLKEEEQHAALRYIPFAVICFLIGLAFAYFVVFPSCLMFTTKLAKDMQFIETYGVAQYFGFMFNIVLPVSISFELPMIVLFLTKLRVLTPTRLRKMRRHAYLILVVCAALISPPELISHIMVLIPLLALYEISIILSSLVYRKQQAVVLAESI